MPTNLTTASLTQTPTSKPAPRVESRQGLPAEGQSVPLAAATAQAHATEVGNAVKSINAYIQNLRRDLQFTVDEGTDQIVVRVIDSETQEVIRQIPSEEVLALARSLEKNQGVILRAQA